ncbi:MAG: hypothetical protein ACPGXL_03580 [Chitinophagales bacterium]
MRFCALLVVFIAVASLSVSCQQSGNGTVNKTMTVTPPANYQPDSQAIQQAAKIANATGGYLRFDISGPILNESYDISLDIDRSRMIYYETSLNVNYVGYDARFRRNKFTIMLPRKPKGKYVVWQDDGIVFKFEWQSPKIVAYNNNADVGEVTVEEMRWEEDGYARGTVNFSMQVRDLTQKGVKYQPHKVRGTFEIKTPNINHYDNGEEALQKNKN